MKEDVIAANLANLRQSVNELKETVNKLNDTSQNHVQTTQSAVDERTAYNSVAKSFCNCWNDALSILNPNRSLEKLAFTLLEIHYNYDNNQAVCYNSEHNKSYHLTF